MQYSYLELAQLLISQIQSQQYRVGERLPSVRALAKMYQLSPSTAVRCYRHLENSGFIHAQSKSGMYVADWKLLHSQNNIPQAKAGLNSTAGAIQLPRNKAAIVLTQQASPRGDALPSKHRVAPPAYEELMSLQHRMSQLYELTEQPLKWQLHLASADPNWYACNKLAKLLKQALVLHPHLIGQYPNGSGWPELKQALSQWMRSFGLDLSENELLITNGSTEATSLALQAVAQPGDCIAVESPVYFGVLQTIEKLGLKAIEIPCNAGTGLSLEALEYALEHQGSIKAVVAMSSFQNPTGSCMPDNHKKKLLKLIEKHQIMLIEDDVFGDLSHQVERPAPIKVWDKHERVIYIGSCSKSLAPGFRIGWIAGGRYHAAIKSLKLSYSLVSPLLEQVALAEFIKGGDMALHLRQLRQRLASNVGLAVKAVAQYFPYGTKVISPAGGWWLWLELPPSISSLSLLKLAIANSISFTPGMVFTNTGKLNHHLRINYARPWAEIEMALQELGQLAHQQSINSNQHN